MAKDPNEKGDLFTDRMKDLVHALGYETQYVNVSKPGRELDIHAKHRIEDRRLIAECKAQIAPVSGSDLNKFAGVLQAEKEHDSKLIGYFISLSGFRHSALVQEEQFAEKRFVTMGSAQILKQLIKGRIIAEPSAAFFAARGLPELPADSEVGTEPDLIAHRIGWIWTISLSSAGRPIGIALVPADGQLLDSSLVREVAADLESIGSHFAILVPPDLIVPSESQAEEKYLEYVVQEFGTLTLEGLPIDQYASASVHRLEEVYVPLHLEVPPKDSRAENPIALEHPASGTAGRTRIDLAQALPEGGKIAVLVAPGAGKSTLIRRVAVALADQSRRDEVADSLPEKPWLPLVLRAREVQRLGITSILEILFDIPRRAEMNPALSEPFKQMLDRKLQTGTALLLVDGLDEIASETDRRLFAHQLRTFVSMYPTIQLIITSREAGFRLVAGEVSAYCTLYNLADLDDDDIRHLITLWYTKITAPGKDAENKAREVAQKILDSDRVRRLASNPLLLTTLLYVQRWAGEIPKRRVLLYDRAIDLLLMTWNVEGHTPLRVDEALPQLAYLAFDMMTRTTKRISSLEAEKSFADARKAMPEVLAYSVDTPHDMIDRIESRSSLLVLAGLRHRRRTGTVIL